LYWSADLRSGAKQVCLNSGQGFGFNGGQFGFSLTGPAAQSVVVQGSMDLLSWLPLWTNTFAGALKTIRVHSQFVDRKSEGCDDHQLLDAHYRVSVS
jgi:hypothetical protein